MGNVYLIQLYNDQESFYKIGISVHKYCRFYEIMKHGYKVKILFMAMKLDYLKALDIERTMQSLYEEYHPKTKFGGYTECFGHIDVNDFKNRITGIIEDDFEYLENIEITWH